MQAAGVVYPTLAELRKIANSSPVPEPTLEDIEAVVLEYYGISTEEMTGLRRAAPLQEARAVTSWIARELTHLSLRKIGVFFGRFHQTIDNNCRKIEIRRAKDKYFTARLDWLLVRVQEEATVRPRSVLRLVVAGDSEVVSNPSPAALEAAPAP